MSDGSTIMLRLKNETAELHTYAENRPLQRDMLKGTLPHSLYSAYLSQLLCVHDALESQLRSRSSAHDAMTSVFKPHQQRVDDLRSDLAFLGVDHEAVTAGKAAQRVIDCIKQTADSNAVALLGMLYVLEGSTNGSKFIAKGMMRRQNMQPGPGLSYLDPYGDAQMENWQAFKRDMDAAIFTPDEADAIVASASTMFRGIAEISDETYEPVPA